MINPAFVAPGIRQAIALPPEFIVPQDGNRKQDCEQNAGKRWIEKHKGTYGKKHVTLWGDDLYCHQPMMEILVSVGYNFILVCKPQSHKIVYEWLRGITEEKVVRRVRHGHDETTTYRFANGIPVKDGEDAMSVNWCEVTVDYPGKRIYRNSFATNHEITKETVGEITKAGRVR